MIPALDNFNGSSNLNKGSTKSLINFDSLAKSVVSVTSPNISDHLKVCVPICVEKDCRNLLKVSIKPEKSELCSMAVLIPSIKASKDDVKRSLESITPR